MGCGNSVDNGKGNSGRHMCLPQHVTDDNEMKARKECLVKNKKDYEWSEPNGFPRHVKELPKHEQDEGEKKWHKEQVFDVVSHGLKMNWRWSTDDVGDFFDKVLGKDDPPFQDFYNMYDKGSVPAVASRWQDDAEFARQKLQGMLPIYIKLVTEEGLPSKFPVTEAHVEDFKAWPSGETLASMQKAKKLFWVDLGWMQSALDADKSGEAKKRNMCVPMMLFFISERNVLMPACIKLHQSDDYPIITSGGQDFVQNRWRVAKILCNAAEGCLHEVSNHLLMTHYVMEIAYVALKHTLAVAHPLHELLSAHFWYTCFINKGARETLTGSADAVVPTIMSSGYDCMVNMLAKGWEEYTMQAYNLEADFKNRGVEHIPDYFYRDDARKIQASIRGYAKNILSEFYKSDKDVVEDTELQAFVNECIDPKIGNLRGSPFINGKAETFEQLLTFVTYIIWGCSGYHAVLNNGQFDFYGFVPNAPGIYNVDPNTVRPGKEFSLEEVAAAFPKKGMALFQVSFIHVLALPTDQPLGDFKHDAHYFEDQPKCLEHLKTWQTELKKIDTELEARNVKVEKEGKVGYPYLLPRQIACSVAI